MLTFYHVNITTIVKSEEDTPSKSYKYMPTFCRQLNTKHLLTRQIRIHRLLRRGSFGLEARLDAELAEGAGAAAVNRLSAEVRRCIATVKTLIAGIEFGTPTTQPARKPAHRPGSAAARWGA